MSFFDSFMSMMGSRGGGQGRGGWQGWDSSYSREGSPFRYNSSDNSFAGLSDQGQRWSRNAGRAMSAAGKTVDAITAGARPPAPPQPTMEPGGMKTPSAFTGGPRRQPRQYSAFDWMK